MYQPGDSDVVGHFFDDADKDYVKNARFSIIYYGLRAASADGELHSKELEAVHNLAKKIKVSKEEVDQILSLIDEENQLTKKRAKIVFPDGLDNLLRVYDEKFLQNK